MALIWFDQPLSPGKYRYRSAARACSLNAHKIAGLDINVAEIFQGPFLIGQLISFETILATKQAVAKRQQSRKKLQKASGTLAMPLKSRLSRPLIPNPHQNWGVLHEKVTFVGHRIGDRISHVCRNAGLCSRCRAGR
jgi:hypothetical protein